MKIHWLLFLVSFSCYGANEKLSCLRDLPPSPLDTNAMVSRVPKPDRVLQSLELQIAERGLELNGPGSNEAQKLLRSEIKELNRKLDSLEAAAYRKDPQLEIYGRYEGQAHEWAIKHHNKEISAADLHYRSGSQAELNQRNESFHKLNDLIHMALIRELATNSDFEPLLKAGFEAVPARLVGASYARQDSLLGYRGTPTPGAAATFEAYVAEMDHRYDLVLSKMEEIQALESIPPDVLAGLIYGTLYRILDGGADAYVLAHTPQELTRVREQLRRKYTDLLNSERGVGRMPELP